MVVIRSDIAKAFEYIKAITLVMWAIMALHYVLKERGKLI